MPSISKRDFCPVMYIFPLRTESPSFSTNSALKSIARACSAKARMRIAAEAVIIVIFFSFMLYLSLLLLRRLTQGNDSGVYSDII